MDTYSKLQAVVVFVTAVLGVVVTFWPPESFKLKLSIVFVFVVLGLTAIWLQQMKETRDKVQSEQAQAELLNWQRGDSRHPPRFGILSGVNPANGVLSIRFTMVNDSDYPAYEVSGRLWDLDTAFKDSPTRLEDVVKDDLVTVDIPSLSGHVVQTLRVIDIPPAESSKRFGAQYVTRAGGFAEKLRAERVNGAWLFAIQVTRFDASSEVLFEQADPSFPRDKAGLVDWSMKR